MTTFRFLHAADIHLDSPLYGLSRYEGLPEEEIRGATRAAFDNLVQRAINENVDFVVLAGDLFDGKWPDMGTGLYFARSMGHLHRAKIPVFILAGNHDAESVITSNIPWPDNVQRFSSREPETFILPDLGVALHGHSFDKPAVTANLANNYPEPVEHLFNIGVLHTALVGREGHADYAPCSIDDLKAKGYQYWALGHVHAFEEVSRHPPIIFPGNTQGRHIRETGPKGAVIVSVQDGVVENLDRIELDVLRWADVTIDASGKDFDDANEMMREALDNAWEQHQSCLPLIARISLTGATLDAGAFLDDSATLRDSARAIAAAISNDLFIEKVRVAVIAPTSDVLTPINGEMSDLVLEAGVDETLADMLAEDLKPFLTATKQLLDEPDACELRAKAADGDWRSILVPANAALRTRLIREEG